MATVEDVKSKIQYLIDASNTATNQSNTDLTSAVNSLLKVYGTSNENAIHSRIDGSLTEIESYVTKLYIYALAGCQYLTTAIFPNATSVAGSVFYGCKALENVHLPKAAGIYSSAFNGCLKLKNITLPEVSILQLNCFDGCEELKTIDLSKQVTIYTRVFRRCKSLTSVILRSDSLCTLVDIDAFDECSHILGTVEPTYNPDGLRDGYIYVPSALINSYKEATNWTALATQFRALEDYTVDGTITGELDPTKI